MMKEKNKEFIKQNINLFESEIDPNEIWAGIQKKRKKKKIGAIWFWGATSFILLIGLFTFISTNPNKNIEKPTVQNFELNKQEKKITDEFIFVKSEEQDDLIRKDHIEYNPTENIFDKTKNSTTKQNINKVVLPGKVFASAKTKYHFSIPSNEHIPSRKSLSKLKTSTEKTNADLVIPKLQKLATTNHEIKTNLLTNRDDEIISVDDAIVYYDNNSKVNRKNKIYINRSIEFYGGYSFLFKTNQVSESSQNSFRDARTASEHVFEGIDFELLGGWNFNNRFSIKTGIQYSQQNERMQWSGSYFEDEANNFLGEKEEQSINEEIVKVATSGQIFYLIERDLQQNNYYSQLNIPIYFSHKHYINNWMIQANFGTAITLLNWANGYQINESLFPQKLENRSISHGLKLMSGADIGYTFNNNYIVSLGLNFQYFKRFEDIITQRYQIVNGRLGMIKKI